MKMNEKNGQGAVEFTIAFAVLIGLFALLFAFIAGNFVEVSKDQEFVQLESTAKKYYDEIRVASLSPDGYSRTFSTDSYGSGGIEFDFLDGTAIRVIDESGDEYIQFLDEREFFYGEFCEGTNEITASKDYGIRVCCGSCTESYGLFECSTKDESLRDAHWRSCANEAFTDVEQGFRVKCPFGTTHVDLSITDVDAGPLAMWSTTLYEETSIASSGEVWFETGNVFTLLNLKYEFNALCHVPTGDVPLYQVFDLTGYAQQASCNVESCEETIVADYSPLSLVCKSACSGAQVCSYGTCVG